MHCAGMSLSDNQLPLGNDATRRDAPVIDSVMSVMSVRDVRDIRAVMSVMSVMFRDAP